MKQTVCVIDFEFPSLEPEEKVINEVGGELIGVQCVTEEDIIQKCQMAFGLINQYTQITRRVLQSLPNLKVVSHYGIGVNTIDLNAATELGICVTNVPDYCMEEVSDHAMALLLACARKVALLNKQVKTGNWDYKAAIPVRRLKGQKLGLLSFGRIAQNLANKAKAFGLDILVFDPYIPKAVTQGFGVRPVGKEELLLESDYISIHTPLTAETRHLIGEEELKMMKPNAFIINTGRGPIIDENALIKALHNGWISGAGLDVLEEEDANSHNPLFDMENVIITPHAAWYSEQAQIELQTKTARGVAEVLQGYFPSYLVNTEVKEKLNYKLRIGEG